MLSAGVLGQVQENDAPGWCWSLLCRLVTEGDKCFLDGMVICDGQLGLTAITNVTVLEYKTRAEGDLQVSALPPCLVSGVSLKGPFDADFGPKCEVHCDQITLCLVDWKIVNANGIEGRVNVWRGEKGGVTEADALG